MRKKNIIKSEENGEPPSRLQVRKRGYDNNGKPSSFIALAVCTKLRQRSLLGALCPIRPVE